MFKKRRSSKSIGSSPEQPPDAEMEVLACLWRSRRATARQIRETLYRYRPMAHGSVLTLLKRLEAKGLVARKKGPVGKAFIYRPTRSARPAYRRTVRKMLERIFGGNSLEMVATLFDTRLPSPQELDRLQQLLDDLRSKSDKQRKNP